MIASPITKDKVVINDDVKIIGSSQGISTVIIFNKLIKFKEAMQRATNKKRAKSAK